MKYKHVIWDWNGTLFDDVDICIDTMNELLNKRSIDIIKSRDYYRKIFCFPVINYYRKLGFDFNQETFQEVADEYVNRYHENCQRASLMSGAREIIDMVNKLNIKQTVISASEQSSLDFQIAPFKIDKIFADVIGIEDNFARSKIDLAKRYFQNNHLNTDKVLFVGDTIHDYEVSRLLGCDCILISRGHQSKDVLSTKDVIIIEDFKDLLNLIK